MRRLTKAVLVLKPAQIAKARGLANSYGERLHSPTVRNIDPEQAEGLRQAGRTSRVMLRVQVNGNLQDGWQVTISGITTNGFVRQPKLIANCRQLKAHDSVWLRLCRAVKEDVKEKFLSLPPRDTQAL